MVGLVEHQAIPTSGEVHLYWNNAAVVAQRPLLFADCEGLGGGSMAPRCEQALFEKEARDKRNVLTKEKKEKTKSRPRGYSRGASFDQYGQDTTHTHVRRPFSRNDAQHRGSPPPQYRTGMSTALPVPSTQRLSLSVDTASTPPKHGYSPFSPQSPHADEDLGWMPGSVKSKQGFTRPIRWATDARRDRQFIVENLYPRLLYTFSDVVVLVMRNAK